MDTKLFIVSPFSKGKTMTEKRTRVARKKREKTDATLRIGNRIKSLRIERGLSQAQAADAAGVSSKYFGEVERGEGNVSIELVNNIANALNVSMSVILENEHERPHHELVAEIVALAPRLGAKDAQIVYRMIKMLTE
jgi:Predicted transcriptional regulators